MTKKIIDILLSALSGWVAGVLSILLLSWVWLQVFPVEERAGQGAGLTLALKLIITYMTPVTIIGGILGGRLPREGGRRDKLAYAALLGFLLPLPFTCYFFISSLWGPNSSTRVFYGGCFRRRFQERRGTILSPLKSIPWSVPE